MVILVEIEIIISETIAGEMTQKYMLIVFVKVKRKRKTKIKMRMKTTSRIGGALKMKI